METYSDIEPDASLERLRCRAIASGATLTDSRTLEWIVEMSDLTFDRYDEIHACIAKNPNINLRTSLMLASSSSATVRESLLLNRRVSAGVLYGLAFDVDEGIRQQAVQHENMTELMSEVVDYVKMKHRSIFNSTVFPGRPTVESRGVFARASAFHNYKKLLSFLQVAYSEPQYWSAFAKESGYAEWHLRELTAELTAIPTGRV